MAFGATMGIASLLIHLTVDFNLQIPTNALLFVVLLGFAHLAKMLPREQKIQLVGRENESYMSIY